MKKYAKVTNEETKACEVGLGTNSKFYQSIGMTEQEVEQAYDGNWYLSGYAPVKPEPTIEEQNEAIRATREQLYIQISDKLKADYDEAVARGADDVEELRQAWLAAKDAVRAAHPYVKESSSDDLQPDQTEDQTTTDVEEDASESDEAEPAATNTLPEQDISSWTGA